MFHDDALVTVVAAEVFKLMDRVHNSTAEGRWVVSDREKRTSTRPRLCPLFRC